MKTKIVKIDSVAGNFTEQEEAALKEAGQILKSGGLVAFPTETVYGLGGDALNRASARKIYEAKGRPSDNPLIVHIAEVEALYRIAENVDETVLRIAKAFWPGPLTIILPKKAEVPSETTGGLQTVAVRLPSCPIARKMIEYAGGFVAAPSANISGRPSPTVAKYVTEDMSGRIDMIIDGGEVGIGLESTILDLTVQPPQILRPGKITLEILQDVLDDVDVDKTILDNSTGLAPKAPGMKYRHYAPKGELTIVAGGNSDVINYINEQILLKSREGKRTGVIATRECMDKYNAQIIKCVGSRTDEDAIAKNLYRVLREFDDENVEVIFSEAFQDGGIGQAIMNRLLKAAGHKMINLTINEKK